jgi:hypothetical protein
MLVHIGIHATSAQYLCQELLVSSLISVLPLLLVGYLHVVEAIKRPDAQKLTQKQRKNHNMKRRG